MEKFGSGIRYKHPGSATLNSKNVNNSRDTIMQIRKKSSFGSWIQQSSYISPIPQEWKHPPPPPHEMKARDSLERFPPPPPHHIIKQLSPSLPPFVRFHPRVQPSKPTHQQQHQQQHYWVWGWPASTMKESSGRLWLIVSRIMSASELSESNFPCLFNVWLVPYGVLFMSTFTAKDSEKSTVGTLLLRFVIMNKCLCGMGGGSRY